jgi:Uma2 family endonuclease
MNAPLLEKTYTPEDLLGLGDDRIYELLDGQLVEKPMGAKAAVIGSSLHGLIGPFVRAKKLGFVLDADGGYELFPGRPRVRKPDVSFIRRGRLLDDVVPEGWVKIAPDLVVEIVSPNDLADELMVKVMEWLGVGVPLVWVVYPASRCVHIVRPGGSAAWATLGGQLSGEDIIPGFSCPVDEIFADV